MIQDIYNNNYLIYTFAGLCGLGILVRFILNMVYIYLVKQSDKVGTTKNKHLKHIKMKFETCYKLNIGVNNVDTFVDKNMTKYRFCGILLSTWENFSGQVLYLSFLIVPISAVFGVIFDVDNGQILYTGAVGILAGTILIFVDKMINLPVKKQIIRLNLLDYLENFCKVRLEHELSQPEKLEQYRMEFLNTVAMKDKNKILKQNDDKEKISRKEARRRKKEEKRLEELKRKEEKRKLEEARREEERKRKEERKRQAALRREEELRRIKEEREALMQRRKELTKKAEFYVLDMDEDKPDIENESQKDENHKEVSQVSHKEDKAEKMQFKESVEEIAAEKEEDGNQTQERQDNKLFINMSPEEERLIEDVLREFFA